MEFFGYAIVGDSYYEAIINWFKRRHNWQIERNSIIYTTGVIPAISASIKALAMPGEKCAYTNAGLQLFLFVYSQSRNANLRKSTKTRGKIHTL